jgi:hypothetical protein
MTRHYIPKDKEDLDFVNELQSMKIEEIKDDIPRLLEWIQDGNWPQAPYIYNYLIPYVNNIEEEIINILRSDDEMWKYWLITGLLYHSKFTPSVSIMAELKKLSTNPSDDEKEAEVDISALDVISKFNKPLK